MTNLQLRIVSGVVLAVIVLALTWTGGMPFRLLAAAIGALVFYEWSTVSDLRRDRPLWLAAWGVVAVILAALVAGLSGYPMLIAAIAPPSCCLRSARSANTVSSRRSAWAMPCCLPWRWRFFAAATCRG